MQRLRVNSNNKMKPLEAENLQAPAMGGAQAPSSSQYSVNQQPRIGSNLPRVSNQKLQVNRSLSSSGQKVVLGHASTANMPNSQLIKNKMKAVGIKN